MRWCLCLWLKMITKIRFHIVTVSGDSNIAATNGKGMLSKMPTDLPDQNYTKSVYPLKTIGWNLKSNEKDPVEMKHRDPNFPNLNDSTHCSPTRQFFWLVKSLASLSKRLPQWVLPSGQRKRTKFLSSRHKYFNPGRCWVISLSYCHSDFPLKSLKLCQPILFGKPFTYVCIYIYMYISSITSTGLNESQTSHSCASMCNIWSHLSQQYTQSSPLSLRRWTHCLLLPSAKMPWRCCFETRYRGHEPANHRSWLKSWGCFVGVEGRPGQSIRIATKIKIQHT